MNINYALISRILIATVFVVAGVQKIMNFSSTAAYISSLGVPMATIATAIVILIEIPVAISFAFGYRICKMGYILIGYIALLTIIIHRDFSVGLNMVMALKDIAIAGGILAATQLCKCDTCGMEVIEVEEVVE